MRITKLILFIALFSVLWACASADVKKTYVPGDTAYDFTLPDQNGKLLKLSDILKDYHGVVLAFYPKDDTKDWIRQFVEFQQNIQKYEARKIKVIGLSRDSAESHRNFIAKHVLNNITLLVDENGKVAKIYNADHWLLPLSRRVYMIIDKQMNITYKKDMGFALLENQTDTLIAEIDRNIK